MYRSNPTIREIVLILELTPPMRRVSVSLDHIMRQTGCVQRTAEAIFLYPVINAVCKSCCLPLSGKLEQLTSNVYAANYLLPNRNLGIERDVSADKVVGAILASAVDLSKVVDIRDCSIVDESTITITFGCYHE